MNRSLILIFATFTVMASVSCPACSDEVDFVRDVRPIFEKHCYACHGETTQKSSYRLDIRSEAFRGGDYYEGGIIIPGDAAQSLLYQFVAGEEADLQMPPEGPRLSSAEIETLKQWLNEGADWPAGADRAALKNLRDHWSFQPLGNANPPSVKDGWPRNEIDRFILARLMAEGLGPAVEADRLTWLRRVSFDLTGLPPTPEEAQDFLNDPSEAAFQKVVERLLASPRYGERWAQHWLDVVRYADTHGFEVNTERPHAWPYRDYVIRAFNEDTPYDQFIREQIVGDQLGKDAATGFLVTASVLLEGQIGKDEPSKRLARQDAIDEIVVNVSHSFLGLSIGCARCHDHKFDPISQRDYYSMQAFFSGVEYGDRELMSAEAVQRRQQAAEDRRRIAQIERALARFIPLAGSGSERPMIHARRNLDRFSPIEVQRLRFTILRTNRLEPCLDELEVFNLAGENVALAAYGTTVRSSGDRVSPDRHELRFINDGHFGNSRSWMSDQSGAGWIELAFPQAVVVDQVAWSRDRNGQFDDRLAIDYSIEVMDTEGNWTAVANASDRLVYQANADSTATNYTFLTGDEEKLAKRLLDKKSGLEEKIKVAEDRKLVFAGTFREPDPIYFLTRGDPEQPREIVGPAAPAALGEVKVPDEADESQRRQTIAEWIASPDNALTARVMVNRIWQWHFGTGLVETANDFGHSGQPPSHPELLDWLALKFISSGWSIKDLHRMIVLSATYRQSSKIENRRAHEIDSNVRLLWRYPSRRLDAEPIRDSMLAVSGQLNLKMYGPGFDLFDKRGGLSGFSPVEHFHGEGLRRLIYAHKVRRERDAVFGVFDCPDAGQSTARRRESTTPLQALNLFNSPFVLDQAKVFATRVESEMGEEVDRQIERVFALAFQRMPTASELQSIRPVVQAHGLPALCRAVFNTNEFLFIP